MMNWPTSNLSSSLFPLLSKVTSWRSLCALSRFFFSYPGRRDALFSYVNEIAFVESSWKHPSNHLKCGVSKCPWAIPPSSQGYALLDAFVSLSFGS
jgi:hypothetical protein